MAGPGHRQAAPGFSTWQESVVICHSGLASVPGADSGGGAPGLAFLKHNPLSGEQLPCARGQTVLLGASVSLHTGGSCSPEGKQQG